MASQRSKFAVGLFVASGIGIAVLAIIWLGMSRFLEKGQYYVTYFDESVQGLDVDSPVKYRGVSIGRVEKISVAPDSKLIQVLLGIETGQTLGSNIVAQLKAVGITGSVFIELDRKVEGEPDPSPPINFPSEYQIVASKPSEVTELFRGIDDVLEQLKSLDLGGISNKTKSTLDNLDQMIADADVKGISASIKSTFEGINGVVDNKRWDKIISSMEKTSKSLNNLMYRAGMSLRQVEGTLKRVEGITADNEKTIKTAIEDFRQAMKNANVLLEKTSSLISGTDESISQIKRHLLVFAQNLEKASENLSRLVENLSEQPSQLIFDKPPIPRKVEPESSER